MASPTIFGAFKPLPTATKTDLISYNLRGSIDGLAGDLAKAANRGKLPTTVATGLTDETAIKAAVLAWLETLVPANKRTPGDDWKSTFVREYRSTWITGAYPASQALAIELSSICNTNKGNATKYYNQTLLVDVDATSPFKAEYDAHVKRTWSGKEKIGWRGDDRTPDTIVGKNLDGTGFAPRKPIQVPIWRTDESKLDVDCDTTVCVAIDIRGCAFFPLSKPVADTWVYCVILSEGWNTYYLQNKVAAQKNLTPGTKDFNDKVWLFNERCVSQARATEIACAIKLERKIRDGSDPLTGVRFRLGEVRKYPCYQQLTASMLIKIENEIAPYAKWYPANPGKWLTYQGEVD